MLLTFRSEKERERKKRKSLKIKIWNGGGGGGGSTKYSGFKKIELMQGNISLNGNNYQRLDPINGCNFIRRLIII